MTKRYCLALDLKPDPELIAAYEAHHLAVWPEILASIRDSGIQHLEIYRIENRLFMIMETAGNFSFEKKALADAENEKVQEWETLMWIYQQGLPTAAPGQKWMLMDRIFSFNNGIITP
jgi:L-rhamnose mutarotase